MKKNIIIAFLALTLMVANIFANDVEVKIGWVAAPAEDRGSDGIVDEFEGESWEAFRDNYKMSRDNPGINLIPVGNPFNSGVAGRSYFNPLYGDNVVIPYTDFMRSVWRENGQRKSFKMWKGRLVTFPEYGNRVHAPITIILKNGWYTKMSAIEVTFTSSGIGSANGFYNPDDDRYTFSQYNCSRSGKKRDGGQWIGGSGDVNISGEQETPIVEWEYIGVGNALQLRNIDDIPGFIRWMQGFTLTCTVKFRIWKGNETQLITRSSTLRFEDYPTAEMISHHSICFQHFGVEGDNLVFRFPTLPNVVYYVEKSMNLRDDWSRFGNNFIFAGGRYTGLMSFSWEVRGEEYFRLRGITLGDPQTGSSARWPRSLESLQISKDVSKH